MSEVRDDPREVLALLNSLGFVGITANQLKAFMKDLKMHRKMKEQERQQWKDRTKKKIISKQEQMLHEILRDTLAKNQAPSVESAPSTESDACDENSVVRIKVRCLSEGRSRKNVENNAQHDIQAHQPKLKVCTKTDRPCRVGTTKESSNPVRGQITKCATERSRSQDRAKLVEASTDSSQYISVERRQNSPRSTARKPVGQDKTAKIPARPLSAPELADQAEVPRGRSKSVASDPTGLRHPRNSSRCSTHSNTKSFIRPWRLQPEAQRTASARKSDPVALYQKYRQGWTQISFPGEDQHASVRWAIREKMLGTDPNPRPILKNAQCLRNMKKR